MYMRIVWGKIVPGKWQEFEATFKSSMTSRGPVKGLKSHWFANDQQDANAGYSITLWDSEADMRAFWDGRHRLDR